MKKTLLLFFISPIFLAGCSTQRLLIDNTELLKVHQAPFKIFSIGNWTSDYTILTLVDASHQYIVVKTSRNDSRKIGDIYNPNN